MSIKRKKSTMNQIHNKIQGLKWIEFNLRPTEIVYSEKLE